MADSKMVESGKIPYLRALGNLEAMVSRLRNDGEGSKQLPRVHFNDLDEDGQADECQFEPRPDYILASAKLTANPDSLGKPSIRYFAFEQDVRRQTKVHFDRDRQLLSVNDNNFSIYGNMDDELAWVTIGSTLGSHFPPWVVTMMSRGSPHSEFGPFTIFFGRFDSLLEHIAELEQELLVPIGASNDVSSRYRWDTAGSFLPFESHPITFIKIHSIIFIRDVEQETFPIPTISWWMQNDIRNVALHEFNHATDFMIGMTSEWPHPPFLKRESEYDYASTNFYNSCSGFRQFLTMAVEADALTRSAKMAFSETEQEEKSQSLKLKNAASEVFADAHWMKPFPNGTGPKTHPLMRFRQLIFASHGDPHVLGTLCIHSADLLFGTQDVVGQ